MRTKTILQFSPLCLLLLASRAVTADSSVLEVATNGTTLAIVRVDSSGLELSPKLRELADQDSSGALAELTRIAAEPMERTRELLQGEVGYFAFDLPYSPRAQMRMITSTMIPESKLKSLARSVWPGTIGSVDRSAGWQVLHLAASPDAFVGPTVSRGLVASSAQAWQSALEQTAGFPVQLAIVYPKYFRDTLAEIDLELPAMLGGGSSKELVSSVDWIAFGMDPKAVRMRLVIQADSASSAKAIKSHIPKLFSALLKEGKLDQATSAMAMAILGLLQPTVQDNRVILMLEDLQQSETLLQLGATAIAATAKPIAISKTQNNLKQLGLAMHNYQSAFGSMPTYHKMEESSGLSWRVHILPFIDQVDLYNEFKLDEAWDSPHNVRLLERMPTVFQPVVPVGSKEVAKPFHTTYLAPIGDKTVFGQESAVNFQHITDGLSNTIYLVEVQPEFAIPWTSPEEHRYDPVDPASKLRSVNGGVSVALMDGSVRAIPDNTPESVWNALFTRNGAEVVRIP